MAPTATVFSQVYDNIWTILEADTELTAFLGSGKRFKFSGLNDTAVDLRPSDCPALIVRPAQTGFRLPNVKEQQFPFTVEFGLVVTNADWKHMWEFISRVHGALMAKLYLNLELSYVRGWEFSRADVHPGSFGKGKDPWVAWLCEFSLTLQIYRDARSGGLFDLDE